MKSLKGKTFLRIPMVTVLVIAMVAMFAVTAFAAYNFMTVNLKMEVREPMVVSINPDWDSPDAGYISLSGTEVTLPADACTAGDVGTIGIKIQNKSDGDITVSTSNYSSSYFSFTGLPNGIIAANTTWEGTVTVKVANDAPPSLAGYDIQLIFARS